MEEQQQFERARLDVAGQGVTVTSWYEPEKLRWRANAPAHSHLLHTNGGGDEVITGPTRQKAIQEICLRMEKRLALIASSRKNAPAKEYR